MTISVSMQRIYDDSPDEGDLVLVDRLWPRGVSRDELSDVEWVRDVAPSAELRTWYGHERGRFEEFRDRYRSELDENPAVERLLDRGRHVTLLTATRDLDHSHAVILRDYLRENLSRRTHPQ